LTVAGRVRIEPEVVEHHRERLQGLVDRPSRLPMPVQLGDELDNVVDRERIRAAVAENVERPVQRGAVEDASRVRRSRRGRARRSR